MGRQSGPVACAAGGSRCFFQPRRTASTRLHGLACRCTRPLCITHHSCLWACLRSQAKTAQAKHARQHASATSTWMKHPPQGRKLHPPAPQLARIAPSSTARPRLPRRIMPCFWHAAPNSVACPQWPGLGATEGGRVVWLTPLPHPAHLPPRHCVLAFGQAVHPKLPDASCRRKCPAPDG